MERKAFYCTISIIIGVCLLFSNTAFGKTPGSPDINTQNLNNIALCYHGFTTDPAEKSEYVGYIEDFKEQVYYLQNKGYTFVPPSQYAKWYSGEYTPDTPIATIIFDDARKSIDIAAQWLIENKIPFGIAIIGKRIGTLNAECIIN